MKNFDPTRRSDRSDQTIVLYRTGDDYVAEAVSCQGCVAAGSSYAEAIRKVYSEIQRGHACAETFDAKKATSWRTPEPVLEDMRGHILAQAVSLPRPRQNAVKALLVARYGKLSNRALAARIGIYGADAPTILSNATGGAGSRDTRCRIALALQKKPSELWPLRRPPRLAEDDAYYLHLLESGA